MDVDDTVEESDMRLAVDSISHVRKLLFVFLTENFGNRTDHGIDSQAKSIFQLQQQNFHKQKIGKYERKFRNRKLKQSINFLQ